jgi:hypothetical protein
MWTEQFGSMMMLMVMAALLRASYEMSRPTSLEASAVEFSPKTELASWQKEWAEKAVKRYSEAQEKKWRNWNEAMFEPVK